MKKLVLFIVLCIVTASFQVAAKSKKDFSVIAYYTGDSKKINDYEVERLSHIIFSFCHVKDGKLNVDKAKDTTTIQYLVSLKQKFPRLKVMLSMGGWSACEPCSQVFSTPEGRLKFAQSAKHLLDYFKCDGLDLDWEYPAIEGFPGHLYQPADKPNFTELVKVLRETLGDKTELSFAAGGIQKYLDYSVEWTKVAPYVDRINIMNYDLVGGYSKMTGHHTPLYSTYKNEESTHRAVDFLLKLGIPSEKLVIGGAFYVRIWKNVSPINNGLYQSGEHINGVDYFAYDANLTPEKGWTYYWDDRAKAAYWYNETEKKFATGDNVPSIIEKTKYAKKMKLGGMMFWELTLDTPRNGLLKTICDQL